MDLKEIRKKLDYVVGELFKTGAKFGIFIATPVLRSDKKLTPDLFRTFSDYLIEFLKLKEVDISNLAIPTNTNKDVKVLREEINHAATKGNKFLNKAVVWSQAKGWFNKFNPKADEQNIIELIPLLHEMAIALEKE